MTFTNSKTKITTGNGSPRSSERPMKIIGSVYFGKILRQTWGGTKSENQNSESDPRIQERKDFSLPPNPHHKEVLVVSFTQGLSLVRNSIPHPSGRRHHPHDPEQPGQEGGPVPGGVGHLRGKRTGLLELGSGQRGSSRTAIRLDIVISSIFLSPVLAFPQLLVHDGGGPDPGHVLWTPVGTLPERAAGEEKNPALKSLNGRRGFPGNDGRSINYPNLRKTVANFSNFIFPARINV